MKAARMQGQVNPITTEMLFFTVPLRFFVPLGL